MQVGSDLVRHDMGRVCGVGGGRKVGDLLPSRMSGVVQSLASEDVKMTIHFQRLRASHAAQTGHII